MPLPVIPPQPDVPGSDDLAALPAGGCGRTLTTVQTISQLVKLRLHQTDLTDNTLETLPVIVILSSHSQLLTSGLYDGLALSADLAEDPLIAVCAVAELILRDEADQHDFETEILMNHHHKLPMSGVFPTAGVAIVPELLSLVITINPVFVPGLEQSKNSDIISPIFRYHLSPRADLRLPMTLFCFKLC